MSERSELFVLSIITRMIMEKHRSEARGFGIDDRHDASHQVLITIEEAQRVLASGGLQPRYSGNVPWKAGNLVSGSAW